MKKILIAVFAVAAAVSAAGAQEGAVNFEGMAVPMPKIERVQGAEAAQAALSDAAIPQRLADLGAADPTQFGKAMRGALKGRVAGYIKDLKDLKSRGDKDDCYEACGSEYDMCAELSDCAFDACMNGCNYYNCQEDCKSTFEYDMRSCSSRQSMCNYKCSSMPDDKGAKSVQGAKKGAGAPAAVVKSAGI